MSVVGDRLKRLRTAEQLSQEKVAKLAGVNQPRINRYERGLTPPPLEILLWYADFFDVSMDSLESRNASFPIEYNAVQSKRTKRPRQGTKLKRSTIF